MKKITALPALIISLIIPVLCAAQGMLPDVDYSGSIVERSTLTGDWGGVRNDWSKSGVQFDNSLTHVAGFVLDGGPTGPVVSRFFKGRDDQETHASFDNILLLDTQKLGLWTGGLFKFRGEGRFGEGVNAAAGSISPVDSDMLFPLAGYGDAIYDLTEATYTHSLSKYLAVAGGILNTLDGDALSLAGSTRGTAQFLNQSFILSPVEVKAVPYKALGGAAVITPTGNPLDMTLNLTVLNTEDSSGYNPFTRDEGTTYAAEMNDWFRLFDRPGKQVLGYIYGDSNFSDFDDPRVILPGQVASEKNRSYALYYAFEHYVYVEDEDGANNTTGMGFFGRFGYSDGNPNPVEFAYSFGFGGNVPGRSQDTFGLGAYYLDLSDNLTLSTLNVRDERGLEAWYNFGVLPWLHITPDFQVIDQGLPGTQTAYVFQLRTHINI